MGTSTHTTTTQADVEEARAGYQRDPPERNYDQILCRPPAHDPPPDPPHGIFVFMPIVVFDIKIRDIKIRDIKITWPRWARRGRRERNE